MPDHGFVEPAEFVQASTARPERFWDIVVRDLTPRAILSDAIVSRLGAVDRPDRILFVEDLSKTRSAKIVRRLVRAVYLGSQDTGDITTLENPDALEAIRAAT